MDIEKVIRDYIEPLIHLSLATAKDNQPWVCEVHFAYDDDLNLYYRSLPTRRHSQEITQNPKVAGNIVKQHGQREVPFGVYFEGSAELLKPGDEQKKAFEHLKQRLEIPDTFFEDAQQPDGPQFYKITVENWYVFGRIGDSPVQKHELTWHGTQK